MTDPLKAWPDRRITVSLVWRGFVIWLVIRAVALAGGPELSRLVPGFESTPWYRLEPPAAALLLLVVGLLIVLDEARRRRLVFLANLGFGRPTVVAIGLAVPFLSEIGLTLWG